MTCLKRSSAIFCLWLSTGGFSWFFWLS